MRLISNIRYNKCGTRSTWVALPLALHGVVAKKDGTVVNVVIGEDPSDPVLGISDLLIHLSGDQMAKTLSKAIEGEKLNLTVGSRPVVNYEHLRK